MVELRGKVVTITGAGGIGSETARAFVQEGCRVAVCDRLEARLESVRERLGGCAGAVLTMVADVSDERQVRGFVEATVERWGRVDVLVNNAGYGLHKPFLKMSVDEIQHQLQTNYMGVVHATKAVLEQYGASQTRPHHQRRLGGRQVPHAELRQLRRDQSGARLALFDPPGRALRVRHRRDDRIPDRHAQHQLLQDVRLYGRRDLGPALHEGAVRGCGCDCGRCKDSPARGAHWSPDADPARGPGAAAAGGSPGAAVHSSRVPLAFDADEPSESMSFRSPEDLFRPIPALGRARS